MTSALRIVEGPLAGRLLLVPDLSEVRPQVAPGGAPPPSPGASSPPFVIGRSLEANLVLQGPRVEDRHAALVPEPGGHRLVPIARRRSLSVDGEPLDEARLLRGGERIEIAQHVLVYERGARAPVTPRGVRDPAALEGDRPCTLCGAPLGATSGLGALAALRIGREAFCSRCVDARLHLDRGLEGFRVLRKIATNEEEVTYLAVDRDRNERVALRLLKAERQADPRLLRRFLVRALVGLALEHPNYLATRGIRTSRGITFVVVEHVDEAYKLEAFVRERAPVEVMDAIYITNQLAEVLRYAREQRVVVAKRKKSGVLVDKSLWVKVLAYDVTRDLEQQVVETQAFADLALRCEADPAALRGLDDAPRSEEEARLLQLASEFAEVYSVGRILFQLLTGKPFGPGTIDLVHAAAAEARARGQVARGLLAGRSAPVVQLLERVIVPRGEERIRTLEDYTRGSKDAFALELLRGV